LSRLVQQQGAVV